MKEASGAALNALSKMRQFDKIKAHQKKRAAKEKNKNKESLKESKRSAQRGQR